MDDALLANYLRLYHSPEIGPSLLAKLLRKFGDLSAIINEQKQSLGAIGLNSKQSLTIKTPQKENIADKVNKDMDWLHDTHHHIVTYQSPLYPPLLREIYIAPALLYIVGNPQALMTAMLAIVGSRKASSYGERNAYWMAKELGHLGLATCSGLARGIDARAHKDALDSGAQTISAMATGADTIYPAENRRLAEEIRESGALVTEFPLGTKPLPSYFPQRNRIISGLSLGTLVVEATEKSGSLITVRCSLEQNREVFAIPGIAGTAQSKGCNGLIKQGAKLAEQPEDILEELGTNELTLKQHDEHVRVKQKITDQKNLQATSAANTKHQLLKSNSTKQAPSKPGLGKHQVVLRAIEPQGSLIDRLVKVTSLEYGPLVENLMELEMLGKLQYKRGRYFTSDC
jgi:DNA processing protein